MGGDELYLGVIEGGMFYPVRSRHFTLGGARLTRIPMPAARSPESDELSLWEMEGRAVLVSGHDGGGWIYSAEIVGKAGPVLSALVRFLTGMR